MYWICYGTAQLEGNLQWQVPFGLFFFILATVASCIWFRPESPGGSSYEAANKRPSRPREDSEPAVSPKRRWTKNSMRSELS
ncbi:hypothetical protein DL771_003756 [Monosporascus sp. 5C6A]|nr:hypothetical protein DL771_003756 [Monosporascus sp. 5C6A]